MDIGIPFFLLALIALGFLILGALVLSLVLLSSEKTRVAGVILLVTILLGVTMIVAVAVFLLPVRTSRDRPPSAAEPASVQFEAAVGDHPVASEVGERDGRDEAAAVAGDDPPQRAEPSPAAEPTQAKTPHARADANGHPQRLLPRRAPRRLNT
jgi:hypothetical protein